MSIAEETTSTRPAAHTAQVRNTLSRYFDDIQTAARAVAAARAEQPPIPLTLSERSPGFDAFADVTDVGLTEVAERLHVLDLMRNPGSHTTKTPASLLMVARAADHVRRTGEGVLILTPTSGNKGTALRDAVARAHAAGLADPERLRIATIVPQASRDKLRACPLAADQDSRRAHPLILAAVGQPAEIKGLAAAVADRYADEILAKNGFRLWFTLDLDNYRIADSLRAFVEAELMPITTDSAPRIHAHAVSSAFGLLGYHLGHRMLAEGRTGLPGPAWHPGFLLVQQLATPDMVTSVLKTEVPRYERDPGTGLFHQDLRPEFPAVTDDPGEVIDPTFYTRNPVTSAAVDDLIGRHGGGGIVVSRRECEARLDTVRALAATAGIDIPALADPRVVPGQGAHRRPAGWGSRPGRCRHRRRRARVRPLHRPFAGPRTGFAPGPGGHG